MVLKKSRKVGIIGSGIAGLACGYFLLKEGFEVVIYEKDQELGGLLKTTTTQKNVRIEKFYHHFFKTDTELLELIKDIGLNPKVIWQKSTVSFYRNHQFSNLNTPLDLLKLPFISFTSRLRFGIATLILKHATNLNRYESMTAKELVSRCFGKDIWDKIWSPLFEGKFGIYNDKIGAAWLWSRIKTRTSSRRNGKETLGYIKGSLWELVSALKENINNKGGKIITGKEIKSIRSLKDKLIIGNEEFDFIISTIPLNDFIKIAPLTTKEKVRLGEISYLGAISTLIELKSKQTNYYWNNVLDSKIPFKGIIEHTNLVSPEEYKNSHLLYLSHYLPNNSAFFKSNDKEIKNTYLNYLEEIIPNIRKVVISIQVFKESNAQPVIYSNFRPLHNSTSLKNLFMTSMAHTYPFDRGMNEAIKEAKKVVRLINSDN